MRKTTLITVALVLILIIGVLLWIFFGGDSAQIIKNYPPDGQVIVAFGDSLVEGVGSSREGNDFVSLTGQKIGITIENFGQAGDTSAAALSRIDKVLKEEPDIVLILLGGNDAIQRILKVQTEANLEKIIARFQGAGAVTVLLGVRGSLLGDAYEGMYENLAERTGSIYIYDVLEGLFRNPKYMDDPIHPNDEGYRLIAERVATVLVEAFDFKR